MARLAKAAKNGPDSGQLDVALAAPGLTPMLRAGVGGLAASLRVIRRMQAPRSSWPSPIELDGGQAVVEPQHITITWGAGGPRPVFEDLIAKSFQVKKPGLVFVTAMFDQEPHPAVMAAAQRALKRTFLQHGKYTSKVEKKGGDRVLSGEVDGEAFSIEFTPYSAFVHQNAAKDIVKALHAGYVDLAGWAYPGAAQRHIQFADTRWFHTAQSALAGTFALAGTVQLVVAGTAGAAIVIPEPTDLVAFARSRPRLTPKVAREFFVASTGDAALVVELALRAESKTSLPGCENVHVVTMGRVPWDNKQKYRVATLSLSEVLPERLEFYAQVAYDLPTRIVTTVAADQDEDQEAGSFFAASALRGFVADNIARSKPWFEGFATATVGLKKPRYIHYLRQKDNRGALQTSERKGLMTMLSHLVEAETSLVRSVHTALRQRFGSIASDTQGNPAVMKNRFSGERENWRLKFAGAKTADQVRGALADLWSRAGTIQELQASWPAVLELLRGTQWQLVRDLALVALASYSGRETEDDENRKSQNAK